MGEKSTLSRVWAFLRQYAIMTFGMWLYAFGWVGIILPAKCTGGGASGVSLLIWYATDGAVPIGISVFCINAVLLVVASFIIGWKFSTKTVFCIIMLSLAMSVMQQFMPENLLRLADDRLLSAILGGIMAGLGVALCFMQGGTTGGTDIVAMIINKYRTISYGRIVILSDYVIIACSWFITHDIQMVIYGYIMTAAFSYTVDMVMAGNKQSSQLLIVSQHYESIASRIVQDLHRGCTILDGTGWFTHKPTKVVLVLCRKSESNVVLRKVKEVDPQAFISVSSVMGVYGKGFEEIKR